MIIVFITELNYNIKCIAQFSTKQQYHLIDIYLFSMILIFNSKDQSVHMIKLYKIRCIQNGFDELNLMAGLQLVAKERSHTQH